MKRRKALIILLIFLGLTLVAPLVFIQTSTFARILTRFIQNQILKDFGIEGTFSDLSVKLIPPGIIIRNPTVLLQEKNIVNMPTGTSVKAKQIEATFEFVQLLNGAVNIQGVVLDGADINLKIDQEYLSRVEKEKQHQQQQTKKIRLGDKSGKLTWDAVFKFNFKSLGLTNSRLNLELLLGDKKESVRFSSEARELTIGKSAVDSYPGYDLGLDLAETKYESKSLSYRVSQIHSSIEVNSKKVHVKNFAAQDETRTIAIDGSISGNILDPKMLESEIHYRLKGPLDSWTKDPILLRYIKIPQNMRHEGLFRIEGTAQMDLMQFPKNLKTKAVLEVEDYDIAGWKARKFTLDSEWVSPNLKLNKAEITLPDGGMVKLSSIEQNVDTITSPKKNEVFKLPLHMAFENADFHQMLGPAAAKIYGLRSKISGTADTDLAVIKGNNEINVEFDSVVDLIIRQFSFDNQKIDQKKPLNTLLSIPEIRLKAKVGLHKSTVALSDVHVNLPNSALTAKGVIDPEHGIDIDINGKVDLKDVGKIAISDIRGVGNLHWTVKGTDDDLVFTFEPDVKEGEYLDLKLGDVRGRVIYDDGKGILKFKDLHTKQGRFEGIANGVIDLDKTDNIDIDVKVPSGTIQDFAQLFSTFITRSAPWYDWDTKGLLNGGIKVSGKTDLDELVIIGQMNATNVEVLGEVFKGGDLKAGFDKGDLFVSNLNWVKKNGTIAGAIRYTKNDELIFDYKSNSLTTQDFDIFSKWDLPYKANVSIDGSGQGKMGSLKSRTKVTVSQGTIKNHPIPESEMILENSKGHLYSNLNVFGGKLIVKSDYSWEQNSQSALNVMYNKFDFIPVLAILNPALIENTGTTSEISAFADIKYRTGALSKLTGELAVSSYQLKRTGSSIMLENPVTVKFNNGDYHFERVSFKGESTQIIASGNVVDGKIKYDFGGHINLKIIELLVPEIAASNGEAYFTGTLRGRAESPEFASEVKVNDADLRLKSLAQPFENLRYKVNWKDDRAIVSDLFTKYASGKVTGNGSVEVFTNKPPKLDFNFVLDNPKIQVYPVVYARSNGKLTLKGESLPYMIRGNVNIADALVKEGFGGGQGQALKSSKFLPQGSETTGEIQLLELDIDVNAERGFIVKNDIADADLKCNLKIIKSIKSPRIIGQVSVNSGRLNFKDNYFTIQSGVLKFNNPAVIDPEFDLTGTTEVKGYKITMVAVGKVSDYQINFQSQPPLSQNDIVNLLTIGVTSSGFQSLGSANKEAYTRDEMVGLIFNQSSVNKSIKDKFGVNVKLDQSSDPSSPASVFRSQSGAEGGATISPKVVIQKQISKKVSASAGTTVGVGDSRHQDVKLDYDMNKNLSVTGVYEDQRGALPQNSRTSVGVDAKFKVKFK